MTEQRVTIHTDGACSGNPGPGGWGAILSFGDHEKQLKGGEPHTTNNGGDFGTGGAQASLRCRYSHRQPIPAQRHHELDS